MVHCNTTVYRHGRRCAGDIACSAFLRGGQLGKGATDFREILKYSKIILIFFYMFTE